MQQNNSSTSKCVYFSEFVFFYYIIIWLCLDGSSEIVIAKFNYNAQETHELSIVKNERLLLMDDTCLWWKVKRVDSDDTG